MPPKTVALIGAVCVTTGWLLASVLTPPLANLQNLPERRTSPPPPVAESVAHPTPFTDKLHSLLRQAPAQPVPRRNPFAFGSRPRAVNAVTPGSDPTPPPPPESPAVPIVVGPRFTLSGTAATESPDGPSYTAVLSDGTTVHLVKVGETVGGYRVVEVTERSITLADASGTQYVLRLAP